MSPFTLMAPLSNIIPKSLVTLHFLKSLMFQIKAHIQGFQMRYQSFFNSKVLTEQQLIFRFYAIWCSICFFHHCRTKMTNFQKLQHRKLENFRGQSRLLRRQLMTKLCNLGMCSKALEVDKDASFHLRLCLVDLDKVQGRRFKRSAMCRFDPPHTID